MQSQPRDRGGTLLKGESRSDPLELAWTHGLVTLLQRLQLLAGFEANGFAGRDGHLGAGSRVAADSGLARSHVEDSESAQLDSLAMR